MQLNPLIEEFGIYPFARLTAARRHAEASGVTLIDFGVGEPREPVPAVVRDALAAAVAEETSSPYPAGDGLPELRAAIAGWIARTYAAHLDPGIEVLPTLGSKEPIYHLAQALIGAGSPRDLVAVTTPGYPVPARGAAFAGAQTLAMALDPASGWLPAYDALDAATWRRLALVWLTTPNNPTGAVAPLAYLEDLAERCRRHGVVLACDEAYGALYLGDQRPASVLELSDPTHVLALHSLSKRSSVPGYRSGFVAGDPLLIAALKQLRPSLGVTPQRFVQRASIAAWEDEEHVDVARERYRAKDAALRPGLDAAGLQVEGGDGGIFRWCRVPGGGDGEAFAERLLGHGVVVTPGAFLGDGGAQHVRIALVPSLADCEAAVARFAAAAQ